jgi:hypothetical protein
MSERRFVTDNGYEYMIDEEDAEKISKYHWFGYQSYKKLANGEVKRERKYIAARLYKDRKTPLKHIALHRVIMDAPEGLQIDHVDGNGLNNKKSNLRICNQSQNLANGKRYRNNKSGYRGVTWHKKTKKWQAEITINHKRVALGYFHSPVEAGIAYNEAAKKSFGEFARLNEVNNGK